MKIFFKTVLFAIIVTIMCGLFIKYKVDKDNIQTITFYQTTIEPLDTFKAVTLETPNLRVTLKGIYDNKNLSKDVLISTLNIASDNNVLDNIVEFHDENTIDFIFEFCGQNNSLITELDFGYLIYDNCGNIFAYSTPYFHDNPKFINYLINANIYNSSYEITQHFATSKLERIWSISSSDNRFLKDISISPLSNSVDLSQIHILIIDPKYKDINSNQEHSIDNTVFEFIINR